MKVRSFFFAVLVSYFGFSQCDGSEPPFDFPSDTVICSGQSLQLAVPSGYDYYQWSTGHLGTTINITNPGTYSVKAGAIGVNLVLNGDFEGGTTAAANNFTTNYAPGSGGTYGQLSSAGQYAISTSPSNTHVHFVPCTDHTSGSGNMFIANGAGSPNTIVWSQAVPVSPNQDFIFRFWETNVVNNPNVAQLQLYINNLPISAVISTGVTACSWTQLSGTWNSGNATQAVLSIINQNTVNSGNDFAIDDIFFAPVCVKKDTVNVQVENLQVSAGNDITFCANDPKSITASANISDVEFQWNTSETTPTIQPVISGNYIVEGISENGCKDKDTVVVIIKLMNWNIDTLLMQPTSCGANDGYVSVLTNGTFNAPPSFKWTGPGAGNPNSMSASVWTNLGPGWYYLTIQSQGCYRYDSVEVVVSNPPDAQVNLSATQGTAPLTVDFLNVSQGGQNYFWNFGNGNTQSDFALNGYSQVYDTAGTYSFYLIAFNGSCVDTIFYSIEVYDPIPEIPEIPVDFEVKIPNVFSPNNDLVNDIFEFESSGVSSIDIEIFNRWEMSFLFPKENQILVGQERMKKEMSCRMAFTSSNIKSSD